MADATRFGNICVYLDALKCSTKCVTAGVSFTNIDSFSGFLIPL